MERSKTQQIELPDLEAEVLRLCIFPESFESIISECLLENNVSVIGDAVKNLLHYKLLVAVNTDISLPWVYDGDKMSDSHFKATAKGVEWMEGNG